MMAKTMKTRPFKICLTLDNHMMADINFSLIDFKTKKKPIWMLNLTSVISYLFVALDFFPSYVFFWQVHVTTQVIDFVKHFILLWFADVCYLVFKNVLSFNYHTRKALTIIWSAFKIWWSSAGTSLPRQLLMKMRNHSTSKPLWEDLLLILLLYIFFLFQGECWCTLCVAIREAQRHALLYATVNFMILPVGGC